jgi:hypothetical protein
MRPNNLLLIICTGLIFSISYEEGKNILLGIQRDQSSPDTKIENPIITIVDGDYVSAIIESQSLISSVKEPTQLIGNVRAEFYDNNNPTSILRADFAEYVQDDSLIAQNNISIYNKQTKDSLYFKEQIGSKISTLWGHDEIKSNNEFIMKTNEGNDLAGKSFESNMDLTKIKITGDFIATSYNEDESMNILKADFAEYNGDFLIAKKNVSIYNLGTKDSLFFINSNTSEIEWLKDEKKIRSSKRFVIKRDGEGCTEGSAFESNMDLSEMVIMNPKGSSSCE